MLKEKAGVPQLAEKDAGPYRQIGSHYSTKKNSTKKAAKLTNPKERNTEGRKEGRSQAANQHRVRLHPRDLQDVQHSQDHCCSVSFFFIFANNLPDNTFVIVGANSRSFIASDTLRLHKIMSSSGIFGRSKSEKHLEGNEKGARHRVYDTDNRF